MRPQFRFQVIIDSPHHSTTVTGLRNNRFSLQRTKNRIDDKSYGRFSYYVANGTRQSDKTNATDQPNARSRCQLSSFLYKVCRWENKQRRKCLITFNH